MINIIIFTKNIIFGYSIICIFIKTLFYQYKKNKLLFNKAIIHYYQTPNTIIDGLVIFLIISPLFCFKQ